MRLPVIATIASISALGAGLGPSFAADLDWEVDNPFRLYKLGSSFALHEKAFTAVRGDPKASLPADIVWRTERRLNDPDCRDPSTPATCAATRRANYEQSRLGWASKTTSTLCYDSVGRPRRYLAQCDRKYSWGHAKEDYILPEAHTVHVKLSAERLAEANGGQCAWSWQARAGNGKSGQRTLPCRDKLTIERVPYSHNQSVSGVSVKVKLPDGREFDEPNVIVEDLLVVGFGDSFASGESNPDRPITFSAARAMNYDPIAQREELAAKQSDKNVATAYGLASADPVYDWRVLPKRYLEDEEKGLIYKPTSREFQEAFDRKNAVWSSADCHRSQYGYPVRVGLQLALENRHRAITMVHLACTGSEVTEGLFLEKDAREQFDKPNSSKVPAQFDQLSDLICRGGAAARTRTVRYSVPSYSHGDTRVSTKTITMRWCPPELRKRPIDVVMLSIGGNDVGFSALALYSMTESASDVAPIAGLMGKQIRFGSEVTRVYLGVLDQRMKAVKDALHDGFGVTPSQVVQTSYEPLHFDEKGGLCGTMPTLGLDVHPKLSISRERIQEAGLFTKDLQNKLECMADVSRRADCPRNLATGKGTGFHLVTEHLAKFARRGMCARDPKRALTDGKMMGMPRRQGDGDFAPYSPANFLPYGHRWRLFHAPNDAFLTANTHREGISLVDLLQPGYAALYSGAMHPTAEGHSVVADTVMPYVRAVVDAKQN